MKKFLLYIDHVYKKREIGKMFFNKFILINQSLNDKKLITRI